jgi:DNA-binding MarR family transcriptional regulator
MLIYTLYGGYMNIIVNEAAELIQEFVIHCESLEYHLSNKLGLTRSETRVIKLFKNHEIQTAINLARQLSLTKSRITYLINSLTTKGLVKSEIDDKDRRYHRLMLTSKGTRVLKEINNLVQKSCMNDFEAYTEEELRELIRLFKKILKDKVDCS